eukprot:362745-Chlamydomonas_euryale.AAC.1
MPCSECVKHQHPGEVTSKLLNTTILFFVDKLTKRAALEPTTTHVSYKGKGFPYYPARCFHVSQHQNARLSKG